MNQAVLMLGGNLGNRIDNLTTAVIYLTEAGLKIIACSPIYTSAAWGKQDQPDFLNQVWIVETNLKADDLITLVLAIEKKMGRKRLEKYGERVIDIDILFFNNSILRTESLTLPHAQLHLRNFVLKPLCSIIPNYEHPILKKPMTELLNICPDHLPVYLYNEQNL